MTPEEYVDVIYGRLKTAGVEVSTAEIGGLPCLIGYRSQFKMSWMASKLHLFTIVGPTDLQVTQAGLQGFSDAALNFADAAKGGLKGLQVGVAAIPIMVSPHVAGDAQSFATNNLVRRFSAFAWPAVIDSTSGNAWWHQGSVMIGGIYAGFMRENTRLALYDD